MFTRELARRLKYLKITVNALHPGVINTGLSRHIGTLSFFFSKYFVKPSMYLLHKTPKQGAQTTIYAGSSTWFTSYCAQLSLNHFFFTYTALDPDLENVSGQYFSWVSLLWWFIVWLSLHMSQKTLSRNILNWSLFFLLLNYYSDCGLAKVSKQGLDDDMAMWLWHASEKLTKLNLKSE